MKLSLFSSYQDSGVQWCPKIPSTWRALTVKRVAKFTTGWTPPSGNSDFYGEEYSWANISDIGPQLLNQTSKGISQLAIDTFNIESSKPGDLLFSFKLSIGQVSLVGKEMFTNEAIATFKKSNEYDIKWAFYAFPKFIPENAELNIYGAPLLNQERIKNAKIFLPPLNEQKKIASYLDCETGKIDALIQKQEKLIELSEERKKQLSLDVLTLGLRKNFVTKESNLAWAPKIPSNWNLCALKRIANMQSGSSITAEQIEDVGLYPVFGGGGLRGYTSEYTHDGIYPLIGRQGALCGNINFSSNKFWASEHAVVVSPIKNIDPIWLGLLLRSMNLGQYSMSAAQPGLSVEVIKNLLAPIPPYEEQLEISIFLNKEYSKIDLLINKSKHSIELLKERRISLISSVVTGKIDVRGLA